MVRMSINIEFLKIRLVRSVESNHESRMDLFQPALITHSMTQVCHNVMLAMYKKMLSTSPLMYVQLMMHEK
jgi:hypothetical protein